MLFCFFKLLVKTLIIGFVKCFTQVNPQQTSYFKKSISRGCTPDNAYPYSFRPHYAQYVDPSTGNISKIIVVPSAMVGISRSPSCISGPTSIMTLIFLVGIIMSSSQAPSIHVHVTLMYVQRGKHTNTCMRTCMHVHACMHIHICKHTHACTHAQIYMHTCSHTQTLART